LRRALRPAALELLATFSVVGAQAFAARLPDGQVCIVFRGTEASDPSDLGTDADCRLKKFDDFPGRVHTGFALFSTTSRTTRSSTVMWPCATWPTTRPPITFGRCSDDVGSTRAA
jgi:hypothetical protein